MLNYFFYFSEMLVSYELKPCFMQFLTRLACPENYQKRALQQHPSKVANHLKDGHTSPSLSSNVVHKKPNYFVVEKRWGIHAVP